MRILGENCWYCYVSKEITSFYSNGGSTYARPEKFKKSDCYINGLSEYVVHMQEHIQLKDSEVLEETLSRKHWSTLKFKNFKPGSIIILK